MTQPARNVRAITAAAFCAALAACSTTYPTDPIADSLHPTAADKTKSDIAPSGAYGALLRIGEATRQAGDPASAIVFFRRAHNADPFQAAPLVGLGTALNELAQYNDAAQAFRDAISIEPKNTEAMRGLANALIGLNQPLLAVDQLKAANAIKPDYRNLNALGVAYDRLGQHQQAQEYYDQGLKLYPNDMSLLNNLGLSQILSRDYDGAIKTLVDAAQLPGAGARQRQNLALAYGMAGRNADAERIARLDLSNQAVASNLAYYGILRAADDATVTAAIMGITAPLKPASGPEPVKEGVPDAVPPSQAAPRHTPESSAGPIKPLAQAVPEAQPRTPAETSAAPAKPAAVEPVAKAESHDETPTKVASSDAAQPPRALTPAKTSRPTAEDAARAAAAALATDATMPETAAPEPIPLKPAAGPETAKVEATKTTAENAKLTPVRAGQAPAPHSPPAPVSVIPVVTQAPAVAETKAPAAQTASTESPAATVEPAPAKIEAAAQTEPAAPAVRSNSAQPSAATAEPVSVIPIATAPAATETPAAAPAPTEPATPAADTAEAPATEPPAVATAAPAAESHAHDAVPVSVVPIVTTPPTAMPQTAAAQPNSEIAEKTDIQSNVMSADPNSEGEAASPSSAAHVTITGLADQKPLVAEPPVFQDAPKKLLAFPMFREDSEPWYAAPPSETARTSDGRTFSSKIYDFFFKPLNKPKSVAALPESARFAPVKPASGPSAASEQWNSDVAGSYRERRDAIPARPPETDVAP